MNEKRINEIRARCEAATPGPWWWPSGVEALLVEKRGYYGDETVGHIDHEIIMGGYGGQHHHVKRKDAQFIAHARQDVPDLLNENQKLREALRRLEPLCRQDIIVSITSDGIRAVTECTFCRAKFTDEKSKHRVSCPFKILED